MHSPFRADHNSNGLVIPTGFVRTQGNQAHYVTWGSQTFWYAIDYTGSKQSTIADMVLENNVVYICQGTEVKTCR